MADKLYEKLTSLIEDGGAAFPFRVLYDDEGSSILWPGMTLRDYFAGQALVGLMLTPGCLGINRLTVVESAFLMADQMLKARDRG